MKCSEFRGNVVSWWWDWRRTPSRDTPSLCCHQPPWASVPRLSLQWGRGWLGAQGSADLGWLVPISFSGHGPACKGGVQPSQAKLSWQKYSIYHFFNNKLQHFQNVSLGSFSQCCLLETWGWFGVRIVFIFKKSRRQVKNYHGGRNMKSVFYLHQDTYSKTPSIII